MADDLFGIVGTHQAGTFAVRSVVAEGGFAVVYRAYHEGFRADVALKCLKVPKGMSAEEQGRFLDQFREEAELLFKLSSAIPSVVRPLQVGRIESPKVDFVPFLALEWLEGESFADLIDNRRQQGKPPMDLERVVRMLAPVADALAKAHRFPTEQGPVSVVHRDLKPENLFAAKLHGQSVVKILDFGIAKVKNAATQIAGHLSSTAGNQQAFTPTYAAPEQWFPKRYGQTGPWTDVWGFAISVVEVLTQQTPIDGQDVPSVMAAAVDPTIRPTPRTLGLATSDAVEAVFRRALAVDPRDRYQDAGVFWADLERAVGIRRERQALVPDLDSIPPTRGAPAVGGGPRNYAGGTQVAGTQPTDPAPRAANQTPMPFDDGFTPSRGVRAQRPAPLQLDGVGVSPLASRGVSRPMAVRRGPIERPLMERIWAPIQLLILAGLMRLGEFGYESWMQEPLPLGGFTLIWVWGPLGVIALGLLVWAFIKPGDA